MSNIIHSATTVLRKTLRANKEAPKEQRNDDVLMMYSPDGSTAAGLIYRDKQEAHSSIHMGSLDLT